VRSPRALACLLMTAAAAARAQTPAFGPQFQVNSYTTNRQEYAHVAMDAAGDFEVAWQSDGQDGDGYGVFEQFVPAVGSVSPEFQVDTATAGDQRDPDAAMDGAGNFVVVWSATNGPTRAVRFRRFSSAGTSLGSPVPIGSGYFPRVAMTPGGDFVVVWVTPDGQISGQRVAASGALDGGVFQVNTYTTGFQNYPAVARNAAGQFVVSWVNDGEDGSDGGISAQRYDQTGTKVGGEFLVNTYTTGRQSSPAVGIDSSGGFVVVWQGAGGEDGDGYGVFGRRYDASGTALGGEFLVNTVTTGNQQNTALAEDAAGNFFVVWDDFLAGGVFGQRFNAAGAKVGSQFPILPGASRGAVALGSPTEALVTGQAAGGDGFDDIVARPVHFDAAHPMAVDAHQGTGTSSNLNGVLEAGETVQVEPSWKKYAPAGFTGAATNLTGPAGPTYTLADATADYTSGDPAGSIVDCFHSTGNCYTVTVAGTRPAPHWDVTFDEALSNLVTKTWTLHVGESFPDVPTTNAFYAFIENLFHNGITGGCGGGNYCPTNPVTRAQMAVFLLKSKNGAAFVPPACTGVFGDVPCPSPFADWIEELSREGITGGCGGGDYCPSNPVTRAQMAVFLLKSEHGSAYVPPTCAGVFGDVPCPSQYANWIERLAAEQITGGCGGGDYCPGNPNTRGQMAVFLVKTFGLPLYGP